MKVLDLFSGIGGFSLGLERAGMETVAFCEIDPFCRKVLAKHWPDVPIYEDVRTLDYDGSIDVITGGYPCQPFSFAGKRQGQDDDRHLWPAMFSLIKKYRPAWVIGENVAGHINMGLDDVLFDLGSEGYGTRAFVIPACAVDAKHRRDRVWIVANDAQRFNRPYNPKQEERQKHESGKSPCREIVAHSDAARLQRGEEAGNSKGVWQGCVEHFKRCADCAGWNSWPTEPNVGRVANGIPRRVDRLRSLGNAVVPQIPELIGNAIMKTVKERTA